MKKKPKSTARQFMCFEEGEFLALERQIEREKKEVEDYLNQLLPESGEVEDETE